MTITAMIAIISWPLFAAADDKPARDTAAGTLRKPVVVTEEALQLHRSALVVDGHNDLPWEMRTEAESSFTRADISQPQKRFHTDIPRLRKGGVGMQFWSAYVPSDTLKENKAARYTLEQIDLIHRMLELYPEAFEMASTTDDIERIHKAGKIASMIGVEGGHSIENSLGVLRSYYRLGVRYMTLTHSDSLDWADSATDKPKANGLSPFGEQVVREMNKIGMLVDISHVSVETMRHVLRVSKAPVIASHSSAYAIAQHPRNIPDEILKVLAEKDGVVMVNFYSGFIVPEGARAMQGAFKVWREIKAKHPNEADQKAAWAQYRKENPYPAGSIHHLIDHIDHIAKVAGVERVGLGSDYDGITSVPSQLEDVSCYPNITQALLDRGYSHEDIKKILGGNLMRVLRKAEAVSRNWKE